MKAGIVVGAGDRHAPSSTGDPRALASCTGEPLVGADAVSAVHPAVMVTRISAPSGELIEYQRGILARWQADCAADVAAIDALVRSGRWQMLYRGVYATYTGPPSRDGVLWAAVLRCGPAAALSHLTAAELDGLAEERRDVTHVTIPGQLRVRQRSEEHTSELQSRQYLVCRLLLEKKKKTIAPQDAHLRSAGLLDRENDRNQHVNDVITDAYEEGYDDT